MSLHATRRAVSARKTLRSFLLAAGTLAASANVLSAASVTFTGATAAWETNTNWSSGAPPTAADDLIIADPTASAALTLDTNHEVRSITFGATGTRTTVFTITALTEGKVITIGAGGITMLAGNTTLAASNVPLTFAPASTIKLSADQTWSVGGASAMGNDGHLKLNAGTNNRFVLDLNGKTLTKTGSGQVTLIGTTVTAGNIIVDEGILKFNGGSSEAIRVEGSGTITVNSGARLALYRNSGAMVLTRDIELKNGALLSVFKNSKENGNDTISSKITIAAGNTATLTGETGGYVVNYAGVFEGTGTIQKNGKAIELTGAHNFAGTLKLTGGGLIISNVAVAFRTISSTSSTVSLSPGDDLTATVSVGNGTIAAGVLSNGKAIGSSGPAANLTSPGSVTGNGILALTKMSDSTPDGGTLKVSGAQTYTGTTIVSGGTLQLGDTAAASLASTAISINNGGTLQLGNGSVDGTFAAGDEAAIVVDAGGTLALNNSAGADYDFVYTGAGTVAKISTAGDYTLSAANNAGFTGEYSVAGGNLILTAQRRAGSITVNGGAIKVGTGAITDVLTLSGISKKSALNVSNAPGVFGSLALTAGHTLQIGSDAATATNAQIAGNLSLAGNSILEFNIGDAPATAHDTLTLTNGGVLSATNASVNISMITGSAPVTIGDYTLFSQSTNIADALIDKLTLNADTLTLGDPNIRFKLTNSAGNIILQAYIGGLLLDWTGATSAEWNTVDTNWNDQKAGLDRIFNANPPYRDDVFFTDKYAAAPRTVTITESVDPLSITVDSIGEYTLVNAGGQITGDATLTKKGTGKLILDGGANDFTGVVKIIGGTLELTGNGPLMANGGEASSLGAGSSGSAALVINGATLRFNGTGTTTQTDRNFTVSDAGATLEVAAGNTVYFTTIDAVTNSATGDNTITLAGEGTGKISLAFVDPRDFALSVTKTGTGEWYLDGANTYTGVTTISAGTLNIAAGTALGSTPRIEIATGATLSNKTLETDGTTSTAEITLSAAKVISVNDSAIEVAGANNTFTVNGTIEGGALTKTGLGTLILNGDNTLTGGININAGTLQAGAPGALAGNAVTIDDSAVLEVISGNNNAAGITGTGTVKINSGAALTLTQTIAAAPSDTANNKIILDNGTFAVTAAGTSQTNRKIEIGPGGATITSDNGTLQTIGTAAVSFSPGTADTTLTLNSNNEQNNTLTYAIVDSPAGQTSLSKIGFGKWIISGNNTYTGATTIASGTLAIGRDNAVSTASALTLGTGTNNAALDLNGYNQTLRNITVTGTGAHKIINSQSTAATLTIDNTAALTLKVDIGSGDAHLNLTKTGTGSLTLNGNLTYTGSTTVKQGTLAIRNIAQPLTGNIAVYSGAQLDVTGLSGGLNLAASQTLTAGGNDLNTPTLLGNYTLNGGTLVLGENPNTNIGRNLAVTGNLTADAPSTLRYFLTDEASSNNSVLRTGTLNVTGGVTVDPVLVNGILAIGTYSLIEYNTFLGDISNITYAGTIDPRYSLKIENDEPRKRIILTIDSATAQTPLIWSGNLPGGVWSVDDANFKNADTGTPESFFPGDYATFDNTAANFNPVVTPGGISIGGITVDNDTAHPYIISGGELRGDGYINKTGDGTLTLANTNSFLGQLGLDGKRTAAVTLAQGKIIVAADNALGNGTTLIHNNTTLGNDGTNTLTNAIQIAAGATTTLDSGTGTLALNGTLTGDTAVIIKKTGTGTVSFGDATAGTATFKGTIQNTAGTIALTAPVNHSAATYTLDTDGVGLVAAFADGQSAQIGALSGTAATAVVSADGAGVLTLQVGTLNTDTAYAGTLQNGTAQLALHKVGTGTLTLINDANTNTGGTAIDAGKVQIGNGGTTGSLGTGPVQIGNYGTLAFNLSQDRTLDADIAGNGTVEQAGTGTLIIASQSPNFAGKILVSNGKVLLTDTGSLGTTTVVNNAAFEIKTDTGRSLANEISGSGSLIKTGTGTLVYTGNKYDIGSTDIREGTLVLGDNGSASVQTFSGSQTLLNGGTLELQGRVNIISDITGTGTITQNGSHLVILAGNITGSNTLKLDINAGTFQIGNGDNIGSVSGTVPITVAQDAVLDFNRNDTVTHPGTLSGTGTLTQSGGTTGTGILILTGTGNFAGNVSVKNQSILQIGDTAHTAAAIGDTVTIAVDSGAKLHLCTAGTTGTGLTLTGTGNMEKHGTGTLIFDGNSDNFTGNFIAKSGTLAFNPGQLPATAASKLQARGTGALEIRNNAAAPLALDNRLTGDGIFRLAADNTVAADKYSKFEYNRTAAGALGTIEVADRANLNLGNTPVAATRVNILAGGLLTGTGHITGDLDNAAAGRIAPGNSVGTVYVNGNYTNTGTLDIEIESAASFDRIIYRGSAIINPGSTLNIIESGTGTLEKLFADKAILEFLTDEAPDTNPLGSSVTGNFTTTNLAGKAITFSTGTGLALLFSNTIADIPGLTAGLNDGLGDYIDYIDQHLVANDSPATAVTLAKLLSPGAGTTPAQALNQASPAGLASMTAMAVGAARDDADKRREHLESLRYERATSGRNIEATPYFTATGLFVENDKGSSSPAFNYNTYGGLVGFDRSFGDRCILGANAGYHAGNATLHNGAGKVDQSSGSLSLYGTCMITDFVYVDASIFGGYDSYEIKHNTIFGRATATPDGYNLGGNASIGGIVPLTKEIHLTPYAGLDYTYVSVDGFTEKGTAAALKVDGFTQDSLQAKIGTGINWIIPTSKEYFVRLGLDIAYAQEILDNEADISARFASDSTGRKFTDSALSTPEQSILAGPSIEFRFDSDKTININYTFEYDLEHQMSHHINASFRMRF